MNLTKDDLHVIAQALMEMGGEPELLDVISLEIEKKELAEVDFDEDDGCAGGACRL